MRVNQTSCRRLTILTAALALCSTTACGQNEAGAGRKADAGARLTAEERELLKTFVDEFVAITPGEGAFPKSFEMGSADGEPVERPVHTVTFDYSFAMAKHEVPQNLYRAVMRENPSVWQGPGRDRNACEMMTWRQAVEFCRRATRLLRDEKLLADDEVIRLPSEAEWEYCCRAGTTTAYSCGENALDEGHNGPQTLVLDAWAWHTGNAAGNDPAVGVLRSNAWGLHDMHGYLWEYVLDSWHADYTDAPADGSAWMDESAGPRRVMRGGSWRDDPRALRSAARWPIPDHVRSDAIGFRCVKARETR